MVQTIVLHHYFQIVETSCRSCFDTLGNEGLYQCLTFLIQLIPREMFGANEVGGGIEFIASVKVLVHSCLYFARLYCLFRMTCNLNDDLQMEVPGDRPMSRFGAGMSVLDTDGQGILYLTGTQKSTSCYTTFVT